MAAKRKYYNLIKVLHEEWCRDNGYKPQATSAKLHANDLLDAENSKRFVESAKPQATSDKRQASKGTSSNKR